MAMCHVVSSSRPEYVFCIPVIIAYDQVCILPSPFIMFPCCSVKRSHPFQHPPSGRTSSCSGVSHLLGCGAKAEGCQLLNGSAAHGPSEGGSGSLSLEVTAFKFSSQLSP